MISAYKYISLNAVFKCENILLPRCPIKSKLCKVGTKLPNGNNGLHKTHLVFVAVIRLASQ